jgi:hypothetical protein
MKNTARLLLAVTALTAATASAGEFVTVEVKARVEAIYDPGNVLGEQLVSGQPVTGAYRYDIHAPDQATDPYMGGYIQPEASLRLTVGALVFESEGVSNNRIVLVEPSPSPGSSPAWLRVMSAANKALPNGATVSDIKFEFRDSTGQQPASEALPTAAPNLHSFDSHTAFVHGELNGHSYSVLMEIESTYSEGMQSDLEISPGRSTFVDGQRFDVALLLPPGSQVAHATSSLDGQPLSMSFPGSCHLGPPNSQNRPTIVCPEAQWRLPQLEGQHRVEWEVELIDGTVIRNPVEWTFIR